MADYYRWFIVPLIVNETYNEPNVMAYVATDSRLDGYAVGGPYTRQEINDAGYSQILNHNDASEWYIAVAWGTGSTAETALLEIADNQDVTALPSKAQDVSPMMDNKFGAGNWAVTGAEIDGATNVGG